MCYFETAIRIHFELFALSITFLIVKTTTKIYFFSSLGVVQGIITGIRGLCNGLGPAVYGFIFFLFHVELNELSPDQTSEKNAMVDPREEVSLKLCEVCSIKFCRVKVCHVSIVLHMFLVFLSVCRSGEEL